MDIKYFPTTTEFEKWLAENHETERELWVGYYKKGSGQQSISWPESVDVALCFGWIDGIRKSIDEQSYKIRFTPRKTDSIWSAVNIKKAEELIAAGRMRASGLKAFQLRKEERSAIYSYEQEQESLSLPYEEILKQNAAAWAYFQTQPPWYRKAASWWVTSAKKEETRLKRLEQLITSCAANQPLAHLDRKRPTNCRKVC